MACAQIPHPVKVSFLWFFLFFPERKKKEQEKKAKTGRRQSSASGAPVCAARRRNSGFCDSMGVAVHAQRAEQVRTALPAAGRQRWRRRRRGGDEAGHRAYRRRATRPRRRCRTHSAAIKCAAANVSSNPPREKNRCAPTSSAPDTADTSRVQLAYRFCARSVSASRRPANSARGASLPGAQGQKANPACTSLPAPSTTFPPAAATPGCCTCSMSRSSASCAPSVNPASRKSSRSPRACRAASLTSHAAFVSPGPGNHRGGAPLMQRPVPGARACIRQRPVGDDPLKPPVGAALLERLQRAPDRVRIPFAAHDDGHQRPRPRRHSARQSCR